MAKRPSIPAEIERSVLWEAGHRCAIHTCRQTPVEVSHIVPWAKCRKHEFENLIALCPTCHARFDHGEIDRRSIYAYKRNLLVSSGLLSRFELRLMESMAKNLTGSIWVLEELELLLAGLLEFGYLAFNGVSEPVGGVDSLVRKKFDLSVSGRQFIDLLFPVEK